MFYAELVYQYVASMQQGINEGNGNIQVLESIVGQSIYGGECYMLTAYYVEKLGGCSCVEVALIMPKELVMITIGQRTVGQ